MKKIKLNNGLKLNKETITKLQESQMSSVKGGAAQSFSRLTCGNASCVKSCNQNSCNNDQIGAL